MTVYFLRHASAGTRKNDPAKDAKRGLDRNGISQAVRIGRVLSNLEPQLDAILTSPLKRASQTAALVANEMGFEGKLTTTPALAPEATYNSFQQMLARLPGGATVVVVGHNPNLSRFLGRMIGSAAVPARVDLRKAGLARVETGNGGAALEWLLTPKLAASAKG